MRGMIWALAGTLCLLGCDDDPPADDAGMDATVDDAGADAGPPPVCVSADPGCVGACEIMHSCVVESGQRDLLAGPLRGYGFSAPDWDECSRCTTRCEADTSADGDAARACFQMHYEASFCDSSPDPTQAANAINTCCEGRGDSRFCRDSCIAILSSGLDLLIDLIPNCEPIADNELTEPTCTGTCPAVTAATHLPVTGDASWRPHYFAMHTDGTIAVSAGFTDGTIDFGAGAHTATSATRVVAVFDADGTPRWSRAFSTAPIGGAWGRFVAFDAAGNLVVATDLAGTLDLGAGDMTSAGSTDVLIAQFAPDGTLTWARRFGGSRAELVKSIYVDASGVLVVAEFQGTTELGGAPLVSAGMTDIVVGRLDPSGTPVWSRALGGPGMDIPWGVVGHPSGDYTVIGGASDGLDFGDGPITSAGDQDSFIARYASDGTFRWVHQYGGPNWDIAYVMDADGEAAVVADYVNADTTVDIAGTSLTGFNQPLLRLDPDGTVAWVLDREGITGDTGHASRDISVSAGGRFEYTATTPLRSADLGGGPHDAFPGPDFLFGSYGADGAHRWSMRMGGPFAESYSGLWRLPSGETILIAEMLDQIDYGDGEIIGEGRDLFMLRFAAD